jgi:hypothetical protein
MLMNTLKPFFACLLLLVLLATGCVDEEKSQAQEIVDAAIAAHGGQHLDQGVVSFKFRGRQYRALRDDGAFLYSRTFTDDSTGQRIHDVLSQRF